MPSRIAALESEQKDIEAQLADGDIFTNDASRGVALTERLGEIEEALLIGLDRWSTLEG
jgi:ATP-binding cassette subfamily F protein uup